MSLFHRFIGGIRSIYRKDREDADLDEELSGYLEASVEQKMSTGMDREAATRATRVEIGSLAAVKEQVRHVGWESRLEALLQDVGSAIRTMKRSRSFVAVVVATMALGIGANTAIFSVVHGVLLSPLPYEEPDRLVSLRENATNFGEMSLSYPNFTDWRAQNRVFEKIGVYNVGTYNLTGSGDAEQVRAAQMSADLFDALRAKAAVGRVYVNDEDKPGATPVVVLSYGLWQRRFGGDASVVGRALTFSERKYTVVGVMPQEFRFPPRADLWIPAGLLADQDCWKQHGCHPGLVAVARMKADVTVEQAREDMKLVTAALEDRYPDSNHGHGATIVPLLENYVSNVRRALYVLLGAVGFVLLIACANVASLTLGRASVRQREMAVRAALGASRGRLIRQMLIESVLLSLLGGAVGLLITQWGIRAILATSPTGAIPRAAEIELDWGVLLFTAVLSIVTGIGFGLVPALQSSRPPLQVTLKETARTATDRRQWLRNGMVVAEVGLTLVLLVGAGLMIRSFSRLQGVDPGFAPESTLSFAVSLPEQTDPDGMAPDRRINFFTAAKAKIQALPGVESVGLSSGLPLGHNTAQWSFTVVGEPLPPMELMPTMEFCVADVGYLESMRIPLLRGRWFNDQDDRSRLKPKDMRGKSPIQQLMSGLRTIVIDEEFARRHFAGANPVGQQIRMGRGASEPLLTIVGVVGRVKMEGLRNNSDRVQGYFAFREAALNQMTFTVRTRIPPEQLVASVRQHIQDLDPNQPIFDVRTLEQIRAEAMAPERLNLTLLTTFAAIAFVLALVGIYGIISWSVTQRTKEIGVRMALGAGAGDVLRLVVGQGIRLIGAGIGLGLAGALLLTRLITTLLFEISPTDPFTFLTIAVVMVSVALLACWIPARRAARVDPMIALRCD